MTIESTLSTVRHEVGGFTVVWASGDGTDGQLSVRHADRILWESIPGEAFLSTSQGAPDVQESRGFFAIRDPQTPRSTTQSIDAIDSSEDGLVLQGWLDGSLRVAWRLALRALDDRQLEMVASLPDGPGDHPRLHLRFSSSPDERFFGFGEQFTHVDLKGRQIDILSQEPGIGRGVQPLTWVMNAFFGAGGDDTRSNAPVPHFVTSRCRSLALENHELSRFDLRRPDRVEVEVWSGTIRARIFAGCTPAELIEAYTRMSGRMAPLPEWIQEGAIVGMQGGTAAVREMAARLAEAEVPVSAFWLQDWVGARKTSAGWQLWWNWELDPVRYPDWDGLRDELAAGGARVMAYVNPFLVDVGEREQACQRNLFEEARQQGFLVRNAADAPYLVQNTSFSAAMVDLTHPGCRSWLKDVLRDQVLGVGVSGWMADFGEALPFDAKLHDGSDAATYHNEYPEAWAQLNREVVAEAGLEGEVAFFVRSGFTRSPGHSTLFWLGDQLTSWRAEDGIRSAVTGLLSSGFSGFSQNHSDIGGYTTTAIPGFPFKIPFLDHRRSRELLWRWIELNAFTAVFRTHEGNQPGRNYQIDGDGETLAHFARFARVYAALGAVRIRLGKEAAATGLPVVRHPWMVFPDDPQAASLAWQFMLGDALMIAPVLDPGVETVDIYLPRGQWQHLWSDTTVEVENGGWFRASSPLGAPAVFFRAGDPAGLALVAALDDAGDRAVAVGRPVLEALGSHVARP
ncbi:MAG: alpha-glucosidase [Myxococcota bacterium]|nr:alpha-glucosidase [Myxococcota bacterium]